MKALIVSGGNPPSFSIIEEEVKKCDIIISADKGANVLYQYGIKPDLIVGDFDSIEKQVLEHFKLLNGIIEKFPEEKDFTDSHAALQKAIDLGAKEISLLACTGSRIDHLLGNIGLLYESLKLGVQTYIRDNNNLIRLVDKPLWIERKNYKYFSLLSYGDVVKGITITGAKYPLNNYNLKLGESLGVSNEVLNEKAYIDFKEGLLFVIQSND
ncbi:thiamine pyrophosphokinase [Clostridium tetanomorphum]|uniref:Thiamine diphosphokinase n=1 Tax=Clostridium tetanomorphum TaxID=1553 RepID=A0A923E9C1_CLOTT|nr:thiamine diphosphokinase [Clostridium tetanomorphum]KAJ51513.1 thiamin pyrophosphokinase [Clostridium tetanomorphum DSM 665]MBC2398865.1 thiamine diphosphokinase [Clostridium tetanomorphum]MBP1865161.1 thiamine pyrophosphokinase [Clostridium tetanomorphum]NRS84700.1 thiamine pyrophosphokinase [Clostridium tetanomorphum]NRZ97915.1 thiamine pyrophosphokinase [Clostridium tetanomorphum]